MTSISLPRAECCGFYVKARPSLWGPSHLSPEQKPFAPGKEGFLSTSMEGDVSHPPRDKGWREFCCVLVSNIFYLFFSSLVLSTHGHRLSQASGGRESLLSVPHTTNRLAYHPLSLWSPSSLGLQEKPHGPLILCILIPACFVWCLTKSMPTGMIFHSASPKT